MNAIVLSYDDHVSAWRKWKRKEYLREYNIKNQDKIRERTRKYYLKNQDKIKEYWLRNRDKTKERMKGWRIKNKDKIKYYNKEYQSENQDKVKKQKKEYNKRYREKNYDIIIQRKKAYRLKNQDKIKEYYLNIGKNKSKEYNVRARMIAFYKIQDEIKCVRCGCDDVRFLEINHKNGGGSTEFKKTRRSLETSILYYDRKTDDLELLCRPCNHIHFLEQKYGEKVPLKVKWNPQPELDIRNFAWVRVR